MTVSSRRSFRPSRSYCLSTLLAAGLLASTSNLTAQIVSYEILPGSWILDDCATCERPAILREITGSFRLEQIPSLVCCIFAVHDLEFSATDGDTTYSGAGEGTYGTSEIREVTQSMILDLSIGAVSGISLTSGDVAIDAPFPLIEITIAEDGERDPLHRFSMHLIAAPKSEETVYYDILPGDADGEEGSYFDLVCPNCLLVHPYAPITGTFALSPLSHPANPIQTYLLREIEIRGALSPEEFFDVRAVGYGIFSQGGEVALLQSATLRLEINGATVALVSPEGPVPREGRLPEIAFTAPEEGPLHAGINYTLRLRATPARKLPPEFRRGDSNGDGDTDIADAVHILAWQFTGGPEPDCLDAADTNVDASHNLSDAVFLLSFLFQGGATPQEPGPHECGFTLDSFFDCRRYDACEI